MMAVKTKLELVAYHLITGGRGGVSALTGLAKLRDLNLRNGVSDLRAAGVSICDEYFEHQHSGGGIARMKRYWPESADDVLKLVALVPSEMRSLFRQRRWLNTWSHTRRPRPKPGNKSNNAGGPTLARTATSTIKSNTP